MDELAEPLSTLLVVVKLQKSKFGGANSGANKLIDFALVLGEEEEFSVLSDVLLKLLLELDDMLKNQFFFWGIFLVGDGRGLLVFELSAPLYLFVDDYLSTLEVLQQLLVCLALHLKL